MRTTTWSAAISVDLDQAISTLQASQIGAANFIECPVFIECLSFPQMLFPDRNNLPVNQSRPLTKSGTSGSEKAFMSAATLNRCCPCGGGNGPVLGWAVPVMRSTTALCRAVLAPRRIFQPLRCYLCRLYRWAQPAHLSSFAKKRPQRGGALRPSLGVMPGAARHDS